MSPRKAVPKEPAASSPGDIIRCDMRKWDKNKGGKVFGFGEEILGLL